ncbi:unnamed protein product [Allacma fusca]|uniref:Transposase n=1 Tax=Allacma fusca TaxID=39272 RepID=A0A8J2JND2_9HEXA|nr:unnamed protein product [Allacma fusca]
MQNEEVTNNIYESNNVNIPDSIDYNTGGSNYELPDLHENFETEILSDISVLNAAIDIELEENYYTSDSISEDYQDDSDETIRNELKQWALKFNISQISLSALLKMLKSHSCFGTLPLDARTIMGTAKLTDTMTVDPGKYVHFGIQKGVVKKLSTFNYTGNQVTLDINIDGLPISKSGRSQVWPIQARIREITESPPFFIGIWHGPGKPKSFNEFMQLFVEDAKILLGRGILFKNKSVKLDIRAYICDAPARAEISYIKGHNAYYGCGKCTQKGKYDNGRVVFSTHMFDLRTDLDTRTGKHFTGETILKKLPVGLVSEIPYEYQHLVCQGVMKKLLLSWCTTSKKSYSISHRDKIKMTERLLLMSKYVPSEFQRNTRSIQDIKYWKATEFRMFLLCVGPLVLKHIIKDEFYKHFMLLHCAIKILVSKDLYILQHETAQHLLERFVSGFSKLYGSYSVSYNVHGLLHISYDSVTLGPLDQFSTFPFENNLQQVKKLIRTTAKPLEQLANRINEGFTSIGKPLVNTKTIPAKCIPAVQFEQLLLANNIKNW